MNRYKSSQKWRKVDTGEYESPDRRWRARRHVFTPSRWVLERRVSDLWSDNGERHEWVGEYLTLADCQEIAERRKA